MSQSLREEIKQGLIWNDVYLNEVMERTIAVIEKRIDELAERTRGLEGDAGTLLKMVKELLK
jgi:DNA-binding ferritin-like protein